MTSSGSGDGRILVTALVLAAVVVFSVEVLGSAFVPGVAGPCAPEFEVERSVDGRVNVSVAAGEFTRRETVALFLVVEDAGTGQSILLNWREAGGSYPVTPGDAVTLDRLPFGLDGGDTVTVRWRGRGPREPVYCPNHFTDSRRTFDVVIAKLTVPG